MDRGQQDNNYEMEQPFVLPLKIIGEVKDAANRARVNRKQCTRLADRFENIGTSLKELSVAFDNEEVVGTTHGLLPESALGELLLLLKKGRALVSSYTGLVESIKMAVLLRAENREAFQEIHKKVTDFKSILHFDDSTGTTGDTGFQTATESQLSDEFETAPEDLKSRFLVSDAEQDKKDLLVKLGEDELNTSQNVGVFALQSLPDLRQLKRLVSFGERRNLEDDGSFFERYLGNYEIEASEVEIGEIFTRYWPRRVYKARFLGCDVCVKENELLFYGIYIETAALLFKLCHPHIVRFVGYFFKDVQEIRLTYFVMELMDFNLEEYIEARQNEVPFSRAEALHIISQIAEGMLFLHDQACVHRDLRSSNVLVKFSDPYVDVKICGFLNAERVPTAVRTEANDKAFLDDPGILGSTRWMAPEILELWNRGGTGKKNVYNLPKADVFSFAMTCYEVLTGRPPWDSDGVLISNENVKRKVIAGERPDIPANIGQPLEGLIRQCWHQDPDKRPGFQLICHVLYFIKTAPVTSAYFELSEHPVRAATKDNNVRVQTRSDEVICTGLPRYRELYLQTDPSIFEIVRNIGSGTYGTVDEVIFLGCKFAIKTFKSPFNIQIALSKEVDMLIKLRNPHIVRVLGYSLESASTASIVMELMPMDLSRLIRSRMEALAHSEVPFTRRESIDIMYQIASGMRYLHSQEVIHRDLKGSNILVREDGGKIQVKITDFGVSQYVKEGSSGGVGTGLWRAPEVLMPQPDKPIDLYKADVYSFSMTCCEVLLGEAPFASHNPRPSRQYVVNGGRPTLNCAEDDALHKIIANCWDGTPEKRPNFTEICQQLKVIKRQQVKEGLE